MEEINKILEFVSDSGSGSGSGSGYGYGSVNGDGSGYGSGPGSVNGDGYGYGYGDGYLSIYGSVNGDGYGYGYGPGSVNIKLKKYKSDNIFYIDNIPTIIDSIHKNVAKGKIINQTDFSIKICYIAKVNGYFAHENSIKKAIKTAESKMFLNMNIEDKINKFIALFNNKDKYSGKEFYNWHNILTGSCEMGRNNFIERNNIDLSKKYTVKYFINICQNDFGGEIIKQLKKYYE